MAVWYKPLPAGPGSHRMLLSSFHTTVQRDLGSGAPPCFSWRWGATALPTCSPCCGDLEKQLNFLTTFASSPAKQG